MGTRNRKLCVGYFVEMGTDPQYELRTGWKETIEEMRARGDL